MAARSVRLTDAAASEVREAYSWYTANDTVKAALFLQELDDAIDRVATSPAFGSPYLRGTRRRLFSKLPYFLVYRDAAADIEVVAVAHAKRRPGYWIKRLKN